MKPARTISSFALLVALASTAVPAFAESKSITKDERLIGTVIAVDAKARSFDLLTGVGYALRVRRVLLSATTDVTLRSAEVPLARLAPGSIVRVDCRTTGNVSTASKAEILQPPARGQP